MNIKKHLPWLGALLPVASMQAETKPNVVVIYVDDMGIGDIEFIRTSDGNHTQYNTNIQFIYLFHFSCILLDIHS